MQECREKLSTDNLYFESHSRIVDGVAGLWRRDSFGLGADES
jgi:hypothetical protein